MTRSWIPCARWRRLACGALASLTASGSAGAQQLQFRHLGPDDGLASSQVAGIVQDRRGFVWLGTADGLSRYDGRRFRTFRHERGNAASLSGDLVNQVYADRQGGVWVATADGLSRYDAARDRFANYMVQAGLDASVRLVVTTVHDAGAGAMWVGTSRGLYRLDPRSGQATAVSAVLDSAGGAPYVEALLQDGDDRLWVGTRVGLFEVALPAGRVRRFVHDPRDAGSLPHSHVRALTRDGAGALWVGTEAGGLGRLDSASARFARFQHDPADPTTLARNKVVALTADRARGLWVGTENGGLDFLDPATGRFTHNRFDPNNPSALNSNSIWSVFQDAGGTLWVGTFSGGVNVSTLNGAAIRHYATMPGDATSLSYNAVPGFAEDREGYVWVATDGGGINRFDPRTGRFARYSSRTSNLNSDAVLDVIESRRGELWVSTWAGGVSRLDRATGRFTPYTTATSNIPSNEVYELLEDRRGDLWIGTDNATLARFDRTRDAFANPLLVVPPGFAPSSIVLLRELRDGRLAVGLRAGGLALVDPATGRAEYHTVREGGTNQIGSNHVTALFEGEAGALWLGTREGLDRLDLPSGRFTHWGEASGLPGRSVMGIAPDGRGALWLSTNRGITRFDPVAGTFESYTTSDGLQGSEFLMRSSLRARDGTLYFGGNNGFNVIRPDRIVRNTRAPAVALTGLQLFNRPVAVGAPGSPLRAAIGETAELRLDHRQTVFTFEFAALDYTAPEKNRYAYRMDGFDSDWQEVGNDNTASYTNLAPGRYTFRVRASNNDGVWNDRGASLAVVITPPYWQTWWFRALVIGGVAFAAFRAWERQRRRRESLAQQKEYLESGVAAILLGMNRLAEGDLTVRLSARHDDEIGRIAQGFNLVVDEIRGIIADVHGAVDTTVAASQEIHASTAALAATAQEQAARAGGVTAAALQLSANAAETAHTIAAAAALAEQSRTAADEGGRAAADTITGMGRIRLVVRGSTAAVEALGESAERIGRVTQAIDGIAEQTNLLALNAAIEAARAGEHGRGFAVVADEVRSLATSTASATSEISAMIADIRRETRHAVSAMAEVTGEVEAGTALVNRAGATLDLIIRGSEHVLERMHQVTAAGEEQAATSSQISATIREGNELAHVAAAGNEGIARASLQLTRLLDSLQARVARFRVEAAAAA